MLTFFYVLYIEWIQALANKEMDLVKGMPSNPAEKNWKTRRSQKLEKIELFNLQRNLRFILYSVTAMYRVFCIH